MNWKFWQRARQEKELDEEIRSHLQMAVQDHMAPGTDPSEAQAEARR